jgi:hypothetical protein
VVSGQVSVYFTLNIFEYNLALFGNEILKHIYSKTGWYQNVYSLMVLELTLGFERLFMTLGTPSVVRVRRSQQRDACSLKFSTHCFDTMDVYFIIM